MWNSNRKCLVGIITQQQAPTRQEAHQKTTRLKTASVCSCFGRGDWKVYDHQTSQRKPYGPWTCPKDCRVRVLIKYMNAHTPYSSPDLWPLTSLSLCRCWSRLQWWNSALGHCQRSAYELRSDNRTDVCSCWEKPGNLAEHVPASLQSLHSHWWTHQVRETVFIFDFFRPIEQQLDHTEKKIYIYFFW